MPIVISGPAGSGKGTVIKQLVKLLDNLVYSISATTRLPRPDEINGVNYHFIKRDEFKQLIEKNEMLEYAEYVGNYYGSPKKQADENMEAGKDVIFEIEVKGARQLREKYPDALLILITPPTFTELEKRLRGRGTESEDVIQKRLFTAKQEIDHAGFYDYHVVNQTGKSLEAAQAIAKIIVAERHRISRDSSFPNSFYS